MRVIKLRRTKGWRLPAGAIICDRRTKWGNPFKTAYAFQRWMRDGVITWDDLCEDKSPSHIHEYDLDVLREKLWEVLRYQKGRTWACWCIDWPDDGAMPEELICHAQVLWMLANDRL